MEFSILNLFFVLLAAWIAGTIAERLRYPAVLGELAVGILLGPPLLGLIHGSEALEVLADVGIILMLLYIGMEIDPRELGKASWPGLLAAIGGFIVPFAMGFFAVLWFGGTVVGALFVAIAVAITSLATKSRILADLRLLNTRIAHVLMAGALVSDTLALIVFAGVISVAEVGAIQVGHLLVVAGEAAAFFLITSFVGIVLFPLIWPKLEDWGLSGRTFSATLVMLIALGFAELAELGGLHAILGSFMAGLFLREGVLDRKLAHDIMDVVHDVSIGFLAPIFFVLAGFHVTFGVFQTDLALLLTVLAVAVIGKVAGTMIFYLPSGHGWREGLTVGMGMNGRGAVEIIIAGIGLEMGIITQEIFSILVFMAISTTAAVPFMLTWSVNWLRSRGELAMTDGDRSGTILIGAGPLARALAQALSGSQPVTLIDSNKEDYDKAVEDGLNAIHGSALDEDVLLDADAGSVETLIAMTTNSQVNILVAQLGHRVFSIPKEYVLINAQEPESFDRLIDGTEAARLFMDMEDLRSWDYWIYSGQTEAVTMSIDQGMSTLDAYEYLRDERQALPLVVERGEQKVMFRNVDEVLPSDRLHVLHRR